MKPMVTAAIIGCALVISSVVLKAGMENSRKFDGRETYKLYGYEGVLYRLNTVNGRMDALVPSNEAALFFPVGQVQLPRPDDKLTPEQKQGLTQNIRTLSQYIQAERAKSLGLKAESVTAKGQK